MKYNAKIFERNLISNEIMISKEEFDTLMLNANKIAELSESDIEINFVYNSIYENLLNDDRINKAYLSQLKLRSTQWVGKIIDNKLLKDEYQGLKICYILRGGGNSVFFHEICHFLDTYPKIECGDERGLFYWDLWLKDQSHSMVNEFNAEKMGIKGFELARQYHPNLIYTEIDDKMVKIKNLPKLLVDFCIAFKEDLNQVDHQSEVLSFFFSQFYQILMYFLGRWKALQENNEEKLSMAFQTRWLSFIQNIKELFSLKLSKILEASRTFLFSEVFNIESFDNFLIGSIRDEICPLLFAKIIS